MEINANKRIVQHMHISKPKHCEGCKTLRNIGWICKLRLHFNPLDETQYNCTNCVVYAVLIRYCKKCEKI